MILNTRAISKANTRLLWRKPTHWFKGAWDVGERKFAGYEYMKQGFGKIAREPLAINEPLKGGIDR